MDVLRRLRQQIYDLERNVQVDIDILEYLKKRLVELEESERKSRIASLSQPEDKQLLQE